MINLRKWGKPKHLFLIGLILVLLFVLVGRIAEFYDVLDTTPKRSTPPEGFSTGVCNSPDFYDWTRGNYITLPSTAEGVVGEMDRYRSSEAPDLSACIPNHWNVTSIPKLREQMKHFSNK